MNDRPASELLTRPNQKKEEPKEDRSSHKAVLGVTFVDAKGKPFGLQYAHLLTCEVVEEALVVTFTTHKVTISGMKLFNPPEDSLMRKIQQHKIEFVTSIVGGEERNFGQHKDSERFVATSVDWEKVKERD